MDNQTINMLIDDCEATVAVLKHASIQYDLPAALLQTLTFRIINCEATLRQAKATKALQEFSTGFINTKVG